MRTFFVVVGAVGRFRLVFARGECSRISSTQVLVLHFDVVVRMSGSWCVMCAGTVKSRKLDTYQMLILALVQPCGCSRRLAGSFGGGGGAYTPKVTGNGIESECCCL